jgi:putative hydrolase of the HAD superfamily
MKKDFKIVGFDADDTLWINEPYYQETEKNFSELLNDLYPEDLVSEELFKTEMENLNLYGYGAKAFMLSMIETSLRISRNSISPSVIEKIIELGKDLINKPVVLLDGVQTVLERLSRKSIKLIVATKGDLLDQERKLAKSNIIKYFHHIEIMSDKKESDYFKLISHLEISPKEFLMIGNSLKSDIKPVLDLGGYGIHVPYHTTWAHENIEKLESHPNFIEIKQITELIDVLDL